MLKERENSQSFEVEGREILSIRHAVLMYPGIAGSAASNHLDIS